MTRIPRPIAVLNRPATGPKTVAILLFTILLAAAGASAQQIPCLDARAEKTVFAKITARSIRDDCGRRHRKAKLRTEGPQQPVSISGHVTHQNGVRMSGVTMTLQDLNGGATRTVVTDANGEYAFADIEWGSRVELTPSLENYEFYPPAVIWEGIVENEIWNFIAVGPPPPPPPPPANQPTLAWSSFFDNSPQLADFNGMLGRDAQGNVYTGGTSYIENNESGNTDIVLFKTDVNGNRVWSRTFDGPGNYREALRDMAVDAQGNIYMTGYSYYTDPNPALNSYEYVTLKYNTDGDLVWTRYYSGNPGYDDFPRSLKLDGSGHVLVTGYSWGIGTFANYATVKYDADGNQMWVKRYVGGNGEIPNEVETDANGNVYVTGSSNSSSAGGSEDIVTIKYNAAGDQVWFNRYNSPSNDTDEGYELEIDQAGNVLVLGESFDFDTGYSTIIHKIDGQTGSTVWTHNVDSLVPEMGTQATAMELDAEGSIIMAGMLYDLFSYNSDSFVAKLTPETETTWIRVYDGPAEEDYDGDTKIAIDAAGNVFTSFSSEGFANPDIQVIKYSAAGVEEWTYRYGNPFFGSDTVLDWQFDVAQTTMLLDEQGNVYIAGESFIPEQSTDLVVFKLEPVAQMRAVPFDFDGDRKADISVYRPETGYWYVLKSSDGEYTATNWGISTDVLVPGDYDGDGKFDPAVYRDGIWYVRPVSNRSPIIYQFGLGTDKPVASDFDNDGRADFSVFRGGTWHLLASATGSYKAIPFGSAGDIPVPSDYDSNRRSDIGVFRSGTWFIRYQDELPLTSFQFGIAGDKIVPADYDGDKKTDYAVFRQGTWYIWQSRTGDMKVQQWGTSGDISVPADYDGDKKADIAVYRGGVWYILKSSDGQYKILQFGLPTDVPVPSAFVR